MCAQVVINDKGLGLEDVGVSLTDVRVDDSMRVAGVDGDWLYAVGDVNGRVPYTHQGKYQARAAGLAIAARAAGTMSSAASARPGRGATMPRRPNMPACLPSSSRNRRSRRSVSRPRRPRRAGCPVSVMDYDLGSVAGAAVHSDGYTGSVRAVIDTERRVIVGMTFVGQDVSEMLHAATIAVVGEVPLNRLWHAVPAYPTMNEVWLRW